MNAKSYIYSLKNDHNGNPILSYDLGLRITEENTHQLKFNTGKEIVALNKYDWMNKDKIWDNGEIFFLVCSKSVSAKYAFDFLLQYACNKIDVRINYLESLKNQYKKLILKAA